MDTGYQFKGDDIFNALLELQIRNLALQQSILSVISTKFSNSEEEADEIFSGALSDMDEYAKKILQDLYARKGTLNLNDILGDEKSGA